MQHIKLNHEVVRAQYDAPRGQWRIRVRIRRTTPTPPPTPNPHSTANAEEGEDEMIDDVADVLVTAVGPISRWTLPDIAGIDAFKGELHHSAGYVPKGKTWHADADAWGDKRVGVIGSVSGRGLLRDAYGCVGLI